MITFVVVTMLCRLRYTIDFSYKHHPKKYRSSGLPIRLILTRICGVLAGLGYSGSAMVISIAVS